MCDFDAIQCLMFIRILVGLNNLSIKDRDWTHNPPTEDGYLPPMWRVELGWFIVLGLEQSSDSAVKSEFHFHLKKQWIG